MKVAVVLGTRPEIIKMSPILRALRRRRRAFMLIHTGQHYSYEMDKLFFDTLELPAPTHRLSYGRKQVCSHGALTGRMMESLEAVLQHQRPDVVLAQGDTNTVLASALVATKMKGVRFGHVEAGLRSYDRRMPEEINRIVSDHLAAYLFAPTKQSRATLVGEGVDPSRIDVTGNTIVDAVRECARLARDQRPGKPYMLLTLHRQENVDDRKTLVSILEGLERVRRRFGFEIVFPMHPRTAQRLRQMKLRLPEGVRPIEPVGFVEFIALQKRAKLVLTDSGGLQEESCILRVPCVTLRTTTERPETVSVGANTVAGHAPLSILRAAEKMMQSRRNWINPFGDGHSGERIVRILERRLK